MTIKETPVYRFKYMDQNEPFMNLPTVTQQVAERLEQTMQDAQIPPGNPDVNAILARLNTLEASAAAVPDRWASGIASVTVAGASGVGQKAVLFPAGRFSLPPIVVVGKQSGTNAGHVEYAENVTKDGFTVTLYGSSSTATTNVAWIAAQASDTSAAA